MTAGVFAYDAVRTPIGRYGGALTANGDHGSWHTRRPDDILHDLRSLADLPLRDATDGHA